MLLYKIFIIIILILLYIITINECIEGFIIADNDISLYNKSKSNDLLNYNIINTSLSNKTNLLKDRHKIDSIPNNINVENNKYYFEYDNKNYLKILNKIFNPKNNNNILIDHKWNNDINNDIIGIYNKTYQFIYNKLINNNFFDKNNLIDNNNVQIIHDLLNKYKIDKINNQYLLDIDLILYREGKLNGKHVNFIIFIDNIDFYVFDIQIKGIVGEDKIGFFPLEYNDNILLYEEKDNLFEKENDFPEINTLLINN
jgi:hypothetical protein